MAMLSIENYLIKPMDYDEIIDEFGKRVGIQTQKR